MSKGSAFSNWQLNVPGVSKVAQVTLLQNGPLWSVILLYSNNTVYILYNTVLITSFITDALLFKEHNNVEPI